MEDPKKVMQNAIEHFKEQENLSRSRIILLKKEIEKEEKEILETKKNKEAFEIAYKKLIE